MQISGGLAENGVTVGNAYDKYGSKNPLVKMIMKRFELSLTDLVKKSGSKSVHEVGCGEGYWVLRWREEGLKARGSDFSKDVIAIAQDNARSRQLPISIFRSTSIYELDPVRDAADLIVCCEVLEHLENPEAGLAALQGAVQGHLICSVPREPLWRFLNVARGRYLSSLGNTPGHIQHWSRKDFIKLVSNYFEVIEEKNPLPWTMLLCRPLR